MNNFSFLKKIIEFVKKYFLKHFTLFWFLPAESAKKSATQEGALLVGLLAVVYTSTGSMLIFWFWVRSTAQNASQLDLSNIVRFRFFKFSVPLDYDTFFFDKVTFSNEVILRLF